MPHERTTDLIAEHEPVDRGDLLIYAERAGIADAERELELLERDGRVTVDEDGDVRLAKPRASAPRPRGMSADKLVDASRRRADRARRREADALAAFRSRHLDGGVLGGDALPAWIERHREPATDYETFADGELVQVERRCLEYDNGSGFVQYVECRRGGVLDELRILGERLARTYGWQPAQATSFVLADLSPMLAGVRVAVSRRFGATEEATVRVVDAHPHQEPETISRTLRAVRQREGLSQRRPDARQAALADFMLGRAVDEAARIAWRRHCREAGRPDWPYSDRSAFSHAVTRARAAYPDAA